MRKYELEIWLYNISNDDLDIIFRTVEAKDDKEAVEAIHQKIKNPYRIIHNNKKLF